jgi:hypothetical protein
VFVAAMCLRLPRYIHEKFSHQAWHVVLRHRYTVLLYPGFDNLSYHGCVLKLEEHPTASKAKAQTRWSTVTSTAAVACRVRMVTCKPHLGIVVEQRGKAIKAFSLNSTTKPFYSEEMARRHWG